MSKPLAVVTVEFTQPVKGSKLIAAVRTLSESDDHHYGTSFWHEQAFDNGDVFVIGQFSKYPYDQILVAPAREIKGVRPDETYGKVEVMSHQWPANYFPVGYEDASVINSVRSFAKKLQDYFADEPVIAQVSAWPQDVTVCAICESITRQGIDDTFCPKDGKNPPTKTVQVTLA